MHVVIVGGGIVGLMTAYELRRRGHEVTVLEQGEPGGAALNNAGLIVPSRVAPLPSPEVMAHLPEYLLQRDSPLYIRPSYWPSMVGWLWRFWQHSNERDFARGTRALLDLSRTSLAFLDGLVEDGVAFEMQAGGVYAVFRDQDEWTRAVRNVRDRDDVEVIAGDDLVEVEPSLNPGMAGALWYKHERSVRPASLVAGLSEALAARGVQLRTGDAARALRRGAGRVTHVETGDGALEADAVVLAAGAWTPRLLRPLCSIPLPIQAGKGYSITVQSPSVFPRLPLYLGQSKIICTPFADGSLRIAGTLEFSGLQADVDPRRLASLWRVTARYLKDWPAEMPPPGQGWEPWVGLRPSTPDGLPVIGAVPGYENAFLASGHGTYGLTLAPGTALVVADLVEGREAGIDLTPFRLERFAGLP